MSIVFNLIYLPSSQLLHLYKSPGFSQLITLFNCQLTEVCFSWTFVLHGLQCSTLVNALSLLSINTGVTRRPCALSQVPSTSQSQSNKQGNSLLFHPIASSIRQEAGLGHWSTSRPLLGSSQYGHQRIC